jgi:hypothetical protein
VKRLAIAAGIALFAFLVIGVWLAGRDTVNPPQATGPVVLSDGLARGERVNAHSWTLDYDKITTSADQTFVNVDGVRNGVIYRNGKPYLKLRAAHVNVNMMTHDFVATGPIHVESASHHNFHAFDTTQISWNEAAQTLDMEQPIVVTSPGATMHIQGLSLDVRTGKLHIDQPDGSFHE